MSIRALRDRSRLSLHKAMAVPAIYLAPGDSVGVACTVRVHHRTQAFGDMAGFDYAPAERVATVPEVIALASEVAPTRGGVFCLSATEAYEVETVMPVDGITVSTQVTRMRQSEIDSGAFPVPGGA